ncbi:hypothetical protein PHLCEN_2v13653 [Hermanssonia centrifuga]|uniref:Uncharacterized protein n=1 Tax=Hermanssonia centrifuga TaxID=98765 RepID=A0A2R6NEP1_9APHY|nr:hypothetical protein PHLCEN_2v13653 [Hermanssonia centrifuga]
MWTWKFTSRVAFSYGTGHKRHHATRRQPNPFGPRSSGDSGVPLHACSSTAGLLAKEPLETSASISVLASDAIPEEQPEDPTLDSPQAHTPLVVSHPHHPRWDDESDPNTTYDNPFYTQPISDMLWLPRDPFSIIDLDDTIDLRISISSEPGAGKLGAWAEDEFIGTALSSVFAGSFGSLDDESSSMQQSRHLDGSEVISLSSGIKSRVDSLDQERDIETSPPRRPSLVPRTLSNASAMSQRRPATLDVGPSGTGFRSFSLGASSTTDILPSPVTHLSVPSGHRRQRSASVDVVGMHARSVPTSASIRSILRTPSGPVTPGATSIISTREAVVGEAIAEWQEAEHERRRQEEAEEEKAKEPRSWLTAWMFARPTTPHAHTS